MREEPGLVGLIHRLQHGIRFEPQEQVSKRIDKFESQLQTYIQHHGNITGKGDRLRESNPLTAPASRSMSAKLTLPPRAAKWSGV